MTLLAKYTMTYNVENKFGYETKLMCNQAINHMK